MTEQLNVPHKGKIWKAASTDPAVDYSGCPDKRRTLRYIRYDADSNVLVAADGFVLAVNGVDGEGFSESVNIPPEALEKCARSRNRPHILILTDDHKLQTPDGCLYPIDDGEYALWHEVEAMWNKEEGRREISLDINLLNKVLEGIAGGETEAGDQGYIALIITDDPGTPIKVTSRANKAAYGFIMPLEKDW